LPYSFASYTHHFTHFFKGERTKITGDPGAVEKGFVFQAPLTGGILTDFGNEIASLFTFIQSIQSPPSPFVVSFAVTIRMSISFVNEKTDFVQTAKAGYW
jgi:hypothetical protein